MLLLSLTIFAAGPLDEIDAARAAYSSLSPDRQKTTLYVSMLGTPAKDRARLEVAFDFAINQTTFRRKPIHLTPVAGRSQTLYSVDVEDLGWSFEAVERMLINEPYFYPLDSHSHVRMMRADWFVREASFGQTYYDLLGFGKTLGELEKRIGLDRKTAENLRARHGARVVESGVTLNPRGVERLGGTLGAVWGTYDGAVAAKVNPFEKIDELVFKQADAHELFGSLPNGLFWWALANAKGELQNAAPTTIASDRRSYVAADKLKDASKERPSYRVVEIQNPHSCMGCHATGLRAAPDFVAQTVAGGKLDVKAYDKKTAGVIEDFYDQRAQAEAMTSDSLSYTRAVERITGKPALEANNIFASVRWQYAEAPVPIEQAARELNVDAKAFEQAARAGDDVRLAIAYWFLEKGDSANAQSVLGLDSEGYSAFVGGKPVPLGGNTLRALVAGTSVPRDIWESGAYREAALLICYQQPPRNAVTRQMVRDRIKPQEKPAKIDYQTPQQPQRKRAVDGATGKPIEFNEQTNQWEFVQ
jgi:hypothetical protein